MRVLKVLSRLYRSRMGVVLSCVYPSDVRMLTKCKKVETLR